MSYDASTVAFIDTETFGLDPEIHPVWEIAVIVDGEEHCWQQQVPFVSYEAADLIALKINGFTERYHSGSAMTRHSSIEKFGALVSGRHLVGCNPSFDGQRLERQWRAWRNHTNPPWHYRMRDINSMMHGYIVIPDEVDVEPPFSSTELSLRLGVDPEGFEPKHSALADARWAKAVYEAMVGPPR